MLILQKKEMANSLFEFQSVESFPEGITNIELSDLQKAVLKLLAFMDHPRVSCRVRNSKPWKP